MLSQCVWAQFMKNTFDNLMIVLINKKSLFPPLLINELPFFERTLPVASIM